MHILILPAGFILWYLAYEAKPIFNDEVTLNWEEKNINKRNNLFNIINESLCVYNLNLRLTAFDRCILVGFR